jgi:hypothetical protein
MMAEGVPAGVLVALLLGVPVSEDVGDAHTGRAAHAAVPQPHVALPQHAAEAASAERCEKEPALPLAPPQASQ